MAYRSITTRLSPPSLTNLASLSSSTLSPFFLPVSSMMMNTIMMRSSIASRSSRRIASCADDGVSPSDRISASCHRSEPPDDRCRAARNVSIVCRISSAMSVRSCPKVNRCSTLAPASDANGSVSWCAVKTSAPKPSTPTCPASSIVSDRDTMTSDSIASAPDDDSPMLLLSSTHSRIWHCEKSRSGRWSSQSVLHVFFFVLPFRLDLFVFLFVVLRRRLSVVGTLSSLDACASVVGVLDARILVFFGRLAEVHLVELLILPLFLLILFHHMAGRVLLLLVNRHRLIQGLRLFISLSVLRRIVVLEVLEFASALLLSLGPVLLLLLFFRVCILNVQLLPVPPLQRITQFLEGVAASFFLRIAVLGPFVASARILISGAVSHIAGILLGCLGLELIVHVHGICILVDSRALDVAGGRIVGVRLGLLFLLRRLLLWTVFFRLLLFRLLFLLLRLDVFFNLVDADILLNLFCIAHFIFHRSLWLHLLLGTLIHLLVIHCLRVLGLLFLILVLLNVRHQIQIILIIRACLVVFVEIHIQILGKLQRVVFFHCLVLAVELLLGLHVFFLGSRFFRLRLLSLVTIGLLVLLLVLLPVVWLRFSFSCHLLILLLLPIGFITLLVLLCLVVIAIPHLFINGSGIKVVHIASLFRHGILLLVFLSFLGLVVIFFFVAIHAIHVSLEFLVRHVDCVLFIFHLARLLLIRFLCELREIFVGPDVLADIFSAFAITKTGARFQFALGTRLFDGITERGNRLGKAQEVHRIDSSFQGLVGDMVPDTELLKNETNARVALDSLVHRELQAVQVLRDIFLELGVHIRRKQRGKLAKFAELGRMFLKGIHP
ncbi:hypothetical protein CCMA1212_002043 [Trichoderma ghanense]|uniref:Uncharacterized protein n=1 Tax=Trichoderma ghanense TaxID=65468 RepID=A0ABY2HEK6_9HYPO